MDNDKIDIKHEHKTWTPEERIRYEKEMIRYSLKIVGFIFLGLLGLSLFGIIISFIIP